MALRCVGSDVEALALTIPLEDAFGGRDCNLAWLPPSLSLRDLCVVVHSLPCAHLVFCV